MTENSHTHDMEGNVPVLGVGELSHALKRTVEDTFARVRVRGEISGFKRAASGHLYMTLKDEDAVLDAVCWRGNAGRLSVAPEDGMEVIATGRLTTYPGRSKYQIVIESVELAGEGALLKLLEDRRRKLTAEGLFDAENKQEIPFLPEVIGVVTSPTGAVIRDILHRLADRFPRRVLLWPVLVQGDTAADQVASAIQGFNAMTPGGPVPRPDLLIVARGGGSLEDLWAFNEEVVVRAAAESDIPLISAVGHETDTTLIDFASDQRAPTPTAAAEMAVPVRLDLLAQVRDDSARLTSAWSRMLADRKTRLEGLARGLPSPTRTLEDATQKLDDWSERLRNSLAVGMERKRTRLANASSRIVAPKALIAENEKALAAEMRALHRAVKNMLREKKAALNQAGALLKSYSYENTLQRGFALVRDAKGKPVMAASETAKNQAVEIQFRDGKVAAVVTDGATAKPKPKAKKTTDDRQGNLL